MIERVRAKIEPFLLECKNVIGFSHISSKPRLRIYVATEEDAKMMPRVLGGYPVETIVVGRVKALPLLQLTYTSKVRPVVGGVSISPLNAKWAGTLGIIINGYLLTNAHVIGFDMLTGERYPKGTKIVQPARVDGGTESDVIAELESFTDINFFGTNIADAAIAKVTVEYKDMEILDIGKVKGFGEAKLDQMVTKVGRTTGLTESTIIDTNATMKIEYGRLGTAIFRDCIVMKPAFAKAGDSGSVIVNEHKEIVGLLFAGSEYITVANKIQNIIRALSEEYVKMSAFFLKGLAPIALTMAYFSSELYR